jgi:predicted transcriptional regulator
MIQEATIKELVALRSEAKFAAETFNEAVAAQAEKHGLEKAALSKYVSALEADKVDKLGKMQQDIEKLIERKEG